MSKLITRRQFTATSAILGGSAILAPLARATSSPPNVLLVVTDDQGYGDLSCHGNKYLHTPNMDRLAAEGIELTQFYVCPVCAPTRASLMTGRYNYRTGVQGTSGGAGMMDTSEVTMAEMFRAAGYATGIFGKWHLGDCYPMRPEDQGFDESLVFKGGMIGTAPDLPNSWYNTRLYRNGRPERGERYCTEVFTDATIRFIETNRNRPFLAYLPYNAPHGLLVVDKKYSDPFRAMGLDEGVSKLYGMVAEVDLNLGRILKRLEELDLEQNTIVIFMSDNGAWGAIRRFNAGLAGWKGSVQDGGIRAPLFFRWPAGVRGGRKVDRVAAHIDVLPTILEAARAKKLGRAEFDGVSLMPLLRDKSVDWASRSLFFQFHRGLVPQRYQNCAVRSQRWKALSRPADEKQHDPKDLPLVPAFKLYDMEKDPGETTDLAEQHPEIVNTMKTAYDEWYEKMRQARGWDVGVIHIGSEKEPVTHLCLSKDNCYDLDTPTGWSVEIERGGRYRVTVNRAEYFPGELMIKFKDGVTSIPLEEGENSKVAKLPAGRGMLNIWVEQKQKASSFALDPDRTVGDCDVEFVNV